jgi:hypothetical protein
MNGGEGKDGRRLSLYVLDELTCAGRGRDERRMVDLSKLEQAGGGASQTGCEGVSERKKRTGTDRLALAKFRLPWPDDAPSAC